MGTRSVVLVIDSQKILVDLVIQALQGDRLDAFGGTSIREAARAFEEHRPDLAIVDPTIDGLPEFLELARGGLKPPKFVGLVDSDESRAAAGEAGIECVADKAAGFDELVATIRGMLNPELAVQGSDSGARVLVVVDDDEGRRSVIDFLNRRGYLASGTSSARDALQLLQDPPPIRVVLLEMSMPDMGGMEALQLIMKRKSHPDVIMHTQVADREVAKQALRAGAFDYVLKPAEPEAIASSIVACLDYADYQNQPWWTKLTRIRRIK